MADYAKMYAVLCAGVSDVLDDMEGKAELQAYFQRLKELLNKAEDIYIETVE